MALYNYVVLISYILFCSSILAQDCHNIPISMDNFKLCVDNVCYLDQQVIIDIQAISGYKTCLQFISPTGDNRAQKLDIGVPYSYFRYSVDNIQYFDDPKTDGKGFCACTGSHSVTCDNNSVHVSGLLAELCKSGFHKDHYCPLSRAGVISTYVYKLGLDIRKRFKALKLLNKFSPFIGFEFKTYNSTWYDDYDGTVKQSNFNPSFNITIISDTVKNNLNVQYVVFDVQSPTDFWLLESSSVNDINEFKTDKLAWVKGGVDKAYDKDMLENIPIRILDCKRNTFAITTNWLNNAAWLNQNKNKLSAVLARHATLIDPEFPVSNIRQEPQLHISPYSMLDNGWIYLLGTSISFIGFNDHDAPVPPPTFIGNWGSCLSLGTGGSFTVHNFGTINSADSVYGCTEGETFVIHPTLMGRWVKIYNYTAYPGVLAYSCPALGYSLATNSLATPTTYSIKSISFIGSSWPSGDRAEMSYNHMEAYFREGGHIFEANLTSSSYLEIPSDNGVVQLSIHFKNFTVRFDSTLVQPVIDNIIAGDGYILVTAHSLTVPGLCLISTIGKLIFTTQTIQLTPNKAELKITSHLRDFNGTVPVIIRCAEKTSNFTVKLSFDHNELQEIEEGFNSTNPYFEDLINPSKWDNIFNNPLTHWKHKLYIIIISIVCIVMLIIMVYICYKMIKYLKNRKSTGSKYSKMPKFVKLM